MNELNVSLQHDDEQELKKLEVFVPAGHEFTGRQIVDSKWPDVHHPSFCPKSDQSLFPALRQHHLAQPKKSVVSPDKTCSAKFN
jgi:hypothetical protein